MTEPLKKILEENEIEYLELRPLRPPDAEIPVIKITFAGDQFITWQTLKKLAPQTGFYPLYLDENRLDEAIEESWEPVHRKLDGHEAVVLPNFFDQYLLALNDVFLGKDRRGLWPDCDPTYLFQTHNGLYVYTSPAKKDEAKKSDLFLLPVRHSWEALALYETSAHLNVGPTEIAWARHWAEKYGAFLYVSMGPESQRFDVERPPHTLLDALKVSSELLYSGFAADLAGENFISEQYYALDLLHRTQWEFWWD